MRNMVAKKNIGIASNRSSWRYVYGPVFSWRLGRSLGIDVISKEKKICNFDCIYCQLGRTLNFARLRKVFVPTKEIVKELKDFPKVKADFATLSGMGEPTLAKNLGDVIESVKRIRNEPVAILTNSLLMGREDVREDLSLADFVVAKLDCFSDASLQLINGPLPTVKFKDILAGLKQFRKGYKKRFAIQSMFIEENKNSAHEIARLCRQIGPDEVQINTPLRPCLVKPLSKKDINEIKKHFRGMKVKSVYDSKPKKVKSVSSNDTYRRRKNVTRLSLVTF